jgi:hypothetical protein
MAIARRRKMALAAAAAVLLALAAPSFTLPWAHAAIVRSLENGLHRRVETGAVHVRLLPLPGFELDDVELGDSPAFGLEPMVIARQAVANLRWLPLLRGELQFSSVSLDGASINLVRNAQGHWNLPALLRTGAAVPNLPAHARVTPAVRIPYLDWSDSRVNFKLNDTKSRFYLDQVSGSLAREANDWRLQLQFEPARTDKNLSNAGVVTLDGRWSSAASLTDAHFDLAAHIRNSYLAATTALVFGHDAGIRGIVSADVRLRGDGRAIRVSGSAQALSVRRADLLPRAAAVAATFAGVYLPPRDEFTLTGLGDAGWRRLRLSGTLSNLFTHPEARLRLRLRRFSAAGLLPLALAVKSGLPEDLSAHGQLSGEAQVDWSAGAWPGGHGAFRLSGLVLAAGHRQLALPAGTVAWDAQALRLGPAPARLRQRGRADAALTLAAALDRQGFSLHIASRGLDAPAADALASLLGLASPWPRAVIGPAQAQWTLLAPWLSLTRPRWTGSSRWQLARFSPRGGRDLALRALSVRLGAGGAAAFTLPVGADRIVGSVHWPPGAAPPLEFSLHARRLNAANLWAALQPPPRRSLARGLLARMLGDAPQASPWLARLSGRGAVTVDRLDWHGIPIRLAMQLTAAAGRWQAPRLDLKFADGLFLGQGSWAAGLFHVDGSVPATEPLRAGALLRSTPYRGLLRGWLWGSIRLARPDRGASLRQVQARGSFALARGSLTGAHGARRFDYFAGDFALHNGTATLSRLEWLTSGRRFTGAGVVHFAPAGAVSYDLRLRSGTRQLRLRRALPPAPARR